MSDTFSLLINLSTYFSREETLAWLEALKKRAQQEGLNFYLALPFDILNELVLSPIPPFLIWGGQYMNRVQGQSFAQSIATSLLNDFGAKFVLLGTQKARKIENESNEEIREKLQRAKAAGLLPILCIGETLEEYQKEESAEVLTRQIGEATRDLQVVDLTGLQIIYEAPWIHEAISRPEQKDIEKAYLFCRELVHSLFGEPLVSSIKVYCPVPKDVKEVETFIHTLHADGFYFIDPHQLAAIDEVALRAKVLQAKEAQANKNRLNPSVSSAVEPELPQEEEEPEIAEPPEEKKNEEELEDLEGEDLDLEEDLEEEEERT